MLTRADEHFTLGNWRARIATDGSGPALSRKAGFDDSSYTKSNTCYPVALSHDSLIAFLILPNRGWHDPAADHAGIDTKSDRACRERRHRGGFGRNGRDLRQRRRCFFGLRRDSARPGPPGRGDRDHCPDRRHRLMNRASSPDHGIASWRIALFPRGSPRMPEADRSGSSG